jgi:arabinogalactan endo-1,4-beta-galactosidase
MVDMKLRRFIRSIPRRTTRHFRPKRLYRAHALAICVVVSVFATAQQSNLLVNASFEDGSLDHWQLKPANAGTITTTDSVDGNTSLALSRKAVVSQPVFLKAGIYELRAFVRPGTGQTIRLELICKRNRRSEISTDSPDTSSPDTVNTRDTDWKELHLPAVFLTRSAPCRVTVQSSGDSNANSLVDSLSLTRHQNSLRNPELLHEQMNWKLTGSPRVRTPPLLFNASKQSANEASISQTVHIPPGTYTLSASYRSSGGQSLARLEANGCSSQNKILNLSPASYGTTYRRPQLRGIRVIGANCTVGLHVISAGSQWLKVSNFTLESDDQPYEMIAGGDVSLTDMVEDHGGVYRLNGVAGDPFQILAGRGMNLARLHLFVDPGNPAFSPSRDMRGSYDNLTDVLRLAGRAHAAGMKIELSLHLSDYWADGDCQTVPHDWLGLSPDALVQTVGNYIGSVLRSFNERGITVDYLAIGNETDSGMLRTKECKSTLLPVNADAIQNPDLLSRIYKTGYRVAHATSPRTLVLWHLANIGRYAETRRYIDAMLSRGAQVNILAYSAYPFWSRQTVRQFQDFANYVTARYHLPVFLEETGYPWAPAAGADNMNNGGPEPYPLTPMGQLDFLNDEIMAIQSADDGLVIGYSYWDATWILAPGTFDNVDNYVLFDRAGNALPALATGFHLRLP